MPNSAAPVGPYKRRDRLEIYRDVLGALYDGGRAGCTVSSVMSGAKLEYRSSLERLGELSESGLASQGPGSFRNRHGDSKERGRMFYITQAGAAWLGKYEEMEGLLRPA